MIKLRRVFALFVLSIFIFTMLSGCSKKIAGVIRIGVFEPTSGTHMAGGMQEVLGIRYAWSQKNTVNIGGKIYQIELVEMDNASDPSKAPEAAKKLLEKDVSVVLGTYGSACAIASGSVFSEKEIPVIGASCTNPLVTAGNEFYFRVCFTDTFQGTAMANFAVERSWGADRQGMKVGVLTQTDDDYSVGLSTYFVGSLKDSGGEIVQVDYTAEQSEFDELVMAFEECDAVFAPSSMENGIKIIKAIRTVNEECMILGGDTWENSSLISELGGLATEVYFSTAFDESDESNAAGKSFVDGFKKWLNDDPERLKENGGNDTVAAVSALGYDAYIAAVKALEAAGTTDGVAVRSALKTLKIDGVTGQIEFDKKGDARKGIAYIKTINTAEAAFKFVMLQTVTE